MKAKDDVQKAIALVRTVTGAGKTKGEDLLGDPELKRQFKAAKAKEGARLKAKKKK